MPRCVHSGRRRSVLSATLVLGLAWLPPAFSQRAPDHRSFPREALRGDLVLTSVADVQLNGQADRLAPGARLRGEDNQLLLTAGLVGQRFTVHYTRERVSGLLMDLWVLRPVERANRPWPVSAQETLAWSFDSVAQTWKKP